MRHNPSYATNPPVVVKTEGDINLLNSSRLWGVWDFIAGEVVYCDQSYSAVMKVYHNLKHSAQCLGRYLVLRFDLCNIYRIK